VDTSSWDRGEEGGREGGRERRRRTGGTRLVAGMC